MSDQRHNKFKDAINSVEPIKIGYDPNFVMPRVQPPWIRGWRFR